MFKELSEYYKAKSLQKVNSAKPKKDPPQMMMVRILFVYEPPFCFFLIHSVLRSKV